MIYDAVIVGAGGIGLSLGLALTQRGKTVLFVDKQKKNFLAAPKYDGRDISIMNYSKNFLKSIGVWDKIDCDCICKLKGVQLVGRGLWKKKNIVLRDPSGLSVGNMVPYNELLKVLYSLVEHKADFKFGTKVISHKINGLLVDLKTSGNHQIKARMVCICDGRSSPTRELIGFSSDIKHTGLTATIYNSQHSLSNLGITRQYFIDKHSVAILPKSEYSSGIVLVADHNRSQIIRRYSNAAKVNFFKLATQGFLGDLCINDSIYSYPIILNQALSFFKDNFFLLGDAALGVNPALAMGFNFGLKSVYLLLQLLDVYGLSGIRGSNLLKLGDEYSSRFTKEILILYKAMNYFTESMYKEDIKARFMLDTLFFSQQFLFGKKLFQQELFRSMPIRDIRI